MKRNILAGLMLLATLCINAQIINIHTAAGVKQYPVSAVDSITISAEGTEDALVNAAIMNLNAFSFDAMITKSTSCQKFVASVYRKDLYNEKEFTEAAEQTFDPDSWYKPLKPIYYENAFIPEKDLNIHSLSTIDGSKFILAVCAMDDLGGMKVYTKEFTIPSPTIQSTASATINVDSTSLRFDHFDFSVRSGYTTAKIVVGYSNIDWLQGFSLAGFEAKTDADKQAYVMKQYQSLPEPYTSQNKTTVQTSANQTYLVYAIPIDENGKIGKMGYTFVTAPKPQLDGKATVQCTSLTQGEDIEYVDVNLKVSTDADAIRLLWLCRSDFSWYSQTLEEDFFKNENADIVWTEFSADKLPTKLAVLHPGDEYALWAVAVDGRGRMSKPVNLCQEATGNAYFTTKKGEDGPSSELTLDGEGKLNVSINEKVVEEGATYDLEYTLTKGDKTAKAFVIRTGESLEADVKAVVDEHLAGYPEDYNVRHEADFATSNTFSGSETSLIAYNNTYGGSFVIFVTLDTDGKFAITHYYSPLVGLKEYK